MNTFTTPYDQHKDRGGQPYELVRIISAPEAGIDEEVLPMAEIRFNDGVTIHAWPEELTPEHRQKLFSASPAVA